MTAIYFLFLSHRNPSPSSHPSLIVPSFPPMAVDAPPSRRLSFSSAGISSHNHWLETVTQSKSVPGKLERTWTSHSVICTMPLACPVATEAAASSAAVAPSATVGTRTLPRQDKCYSRSHQGLPPPKRSSYTSVGTYHGCFRCCKYIHLIIAYSPVWIGQNDYCFLGKLL